MVFVINSTSPNDTFWMQLFDNMNKYQNRHTGPIIFEEFLEFLMDPIIRTKVDENGTNLEVYSFKLKDNFGNRSTVDG